MKVVLVALLSIGLASPLHSSETSDAPEWSPYADWRIIGGGPAQLGEYPYQISMRNKQGKHHCGGSIIGHDVILTAAHCVVGASPSDFTVVVGTTKLNAGGATYAIKSIRAHKLYNSFTIKNDIALLILKTDITFSDHVAAIGLQSTYDVDVIEEAILSGWGSTAYPAGTTPNDLQYIELKTITVKECKKQNNFPPVDASQVCTFTKAGQGACHGDSGGPLVANGQQIGIVSWGRPCAVGKPDVFTRVSHYTDWINENQKGYRPKIQI